MLHSQQIQVVGSSTSTATVVECSASTVGGGQKVLVSESVDRVEVERTERPRSQRHSCSHSHRCSSDLQAQSQSARSRPSCSGIANEDWENASPTTHSGPPGFLSALRREPPGIRISIYPDCSQRLNTTAARWKKGSRPQILTTKSPGTPSKHRKELPDLHLHRGKIPIWPFSTRSVGSALPNQFSDCRPAGRNPRSVSVDLQLTGLQAHSSGFMHECVEPGRATAKRKVHAGKAPLRLATSQYPPLDRGNLLTSM